MDDRAEQSEWLDGELYTKLRQLAAYYLRMERAGHTLQPTALVHEAYVRVFGSQTPCLNDNAHILYTLVRAMHHVLVDYARRRSASKRRGPGLMLTDWSPQEDKYRRMADILCVDAALEALEKLNSRQARIVELRYFAGFTEQEAAELLQVSRETVKRDWRFAKAWLQARLAQVDSPLGVTQQNLNSTCV